MRPGPSAVAVSTIFASLVLLVLIPIPGLCNHKHAVRSKQWYIPTRLTAKVPCMTEQADSVQSLEADRSSVALYRWIQDDGNIIGSGFHQIVRLLRTPSSSKEQFYTVRIICMMFDWSAEPSGTIEHSINFYEAPSLTVAVTVNFQFKKNLTDFIEYMDRVQIARDWCLREPRCMQALVAPVRDPELEFPHLFELARAYRRTPLTDLLKEVRRAEAEDTASNYLFHVNFVLRLSHSRDYDELCDPMNAACSKRIIQTRKVLVMAFGDFAIQALDSFSEDRAAARKLLDTHLSLVSIPTDVLNFTIRFTTLSLCPPGFGPANLTTGALFPNYHANVTAVLCIACPPGSYGYNGLNCFPAPVNSYASENGSTEATPCPDMYVTDKTGSTSRQECVYNGTAPVMVIMQCMEAAWAAIETFFYHKELSLSVGILIAYVAFTAYVLFWQLHRLVTLMQYKWRRSMSDRLLKRFIAEAYLRDVRRLQYWRAAIENAKEMEHSRFAS